MRSVHWFLLLTIFWVGVFLAVASYSALQNHTDVSALNVVLGLLLLAWPASLLGVVIDAWDARNRA